MRKLLLSLLSVSLAAAFTTAHAQGTAFMYQGRLENNGTPANGNYDLTFTLYTTNVDGVAVAGPIMDSATAVTNGLFNVTIDFGSGVFTGTNYWLDISVSPAGSNTFTDLTPRQPILPTPYALMATTASTLLGPLPASQMTGTIPMTQLSSVILTNTETGVTLSGVFNGNGGGLTALNPANLGAGTADINISGNAATATSATTATTAATATLASNLVSGASIMSAFITNSVFAGNGGGLTDLPAASISTNGSSAGQVLTSSGGVTKWANVTPSLGGVPTLVTNSTLSTNAVLVGRDHGFFLGFITSTANQQSSFNYFTIKLSQAVSTNAVIATFSQGAWGPWTNSYTTFKETQGFQLLTTSNSITVQSVNAAPSSFSAGMFVHVDQY